MRGKREYYTLFNISKIYFPRTWSSFLLSLNCQFFMKPDSHARETREEIRVMTESDADGLWWWSWWHAPVDQGDSEKWQRVSGVSSDNTYHSNIQKHIKEIKSGPVFKDHELTSKLPYQQLSTSIFNITYHKLSEAIDGKSIKDRCPNISMTMISW